MKNKNLKIALMTSLIGMLLNINDVLAQKGTSIVRHLPSIWGRNEKIMIGYLKQPESKGRTTENVEGVETVLPYATEKTEEMDVEEDHSSTNISSSNRYCDAYGTTGFAHELNMNMLNLKILLCTSVLDKKKAMLESERYTDSIF